MNLLQQIISLGLTSILVPSALLAQSAFVQPEEGQIHIAGSSTVFPFVTKVATEYTEKTGNAYPTIEATGTGAGIIQFCSNTPDISIDIATASRRILTSEIQLCFNNAHSEIIEIKLGYDGIGLTRSRLASDMALSLKDIYLALAAKLPSTDSNGNVILIDNPYKTWNEINPSLPEEPIHFFGPPATSGTRDAFDELVLFEGCLNASEGDAGEVEQASKCSEIRTDGIYTEIGENDDLIIQRLQTNDTAVGIIGFNFLNRNNAILQAIPIAHIGSKPQLPTSDNIKNGNYPISRTLYLYIKKDRMESSDALQAYINELTSEAAFGDDGYLAKEGLIPLSIKNRNATVETLEKMRTLKRDIDIPATTLQ
ncbi:substrate-binding domain-containing protein [Kordiimonas sp. SCSIO 12610]|uniref:substrate-binding domain-containing protein n=1 Tax=Kordiimonas sp. SCSIO 12610 TaxID=2829597 RepID=UPI00210A8EBD|nr:substrate-binding domain-containing protein [Kordiimonas sp. SCSIO 12610]UTW54145.1 substrate-binding domain-containing protein [Kordiimonas sp. SCSIO 12610]